MNSAANFQDATTIDPSRAIAFYWLGRSKFSIKSQETLGEARAALLRAAELEPNDSATHYWLGRVLLASGENNEAMKEFEKSILNSKHMEYHYFLILTMLSAAEEKRADKGKQTSLYEKALKQANNSIAIAESEHDDKGLSKIQELQGQTWNALAYTYAERGEHLSIAESYIEKALVRKPNEPHYLDTNAWVSIRRTELSNSLSKDQREARLLSAEQLLKKAIDLLPSDAADTRAETIFHLGYIERLRGKDDAAQRLFLEALELNPEYQNAKDALSK